MELKKSIWYFPNTKEGQKDYEKQWEDDKQFAPIVLPHAGLPFFDKK